MVDKLEILIYKNMSISSYLSTSMVGDVRGIGDKLNTFSTTDLAILPISTIPAISSFSPYPFAVHLILPIYHIPLVRVGRKKIAKVLDTLNILFTLQFQNIAHFQTFAVGIAAPTLCISIYHVNC